MFLYHRITTLVPMLLLEILVLGKNIQPAHAIKCYVCIASASTDCDKEPWSYEEECSSDFDYCFTKEDDQSTSQTVRGCSTQAIADAYKSKGMLCDILKEVESSGDNVTLKEKCSFCDYDLCNEASSLTKVSKLPLFVVFSLICFPLSGV
ncbi:hypothetical protein Ocin01_14155 [Orchesella cincta]|uniref:Uncharacterized protein n=1 Tax=Orchesella cincta TaxID=48709 RepID=A0A1D2MHZ4_ORCCI|nr:hypothetical protein Ocin01_14155 [Orchesella cincta]